MRPLPSIADGPDRSVDGLPAASAGCTEQKARKPESRLEEELSKVTAQRAGILFMITKSTHEDPEDL
jgi:hypothetical protein